MTQRKSILFKIFLLSIIGILSIPNQSILAKSRIFTFVIISETSTTINIGDELYLFAVTSTGDMPTWKSSNSKIASVDTYGKITAKKAGTTTIRAKIKGAEASCKVTVNKTSVSISTKTASIEHNEVIQLTANTSNGSVVTWKSNRKSVASVDENGKVTGNKPGDATITAVADGTSITCHITVKSPSISLSKSNIALYRGQTAKLSASVSSHITPKWKSNKKSVATVDEYGNITAVKHGTAIITATVDGISRSCTVTVKQPDIILSTTELTLCVDSTASLTAIVSSGNTPTWTSSNSNVVTVDMNGNLLALKKGTAYISVSEDGTKVKCKVKVIEP
ncbi:MAG TPA: Ig-like domain-containing protein [Lachnospiraceae bacterium]|nr:Ig-like domain-containing protein [Lachnospiraceae bacterium]